MDSGSRGKSDNGSAPDMRRNNKLGHHSLNSWAKPHFPDYSLYATLLLTDIFTKFMSSEISVSKEL